MEWAEAFRDGIQPLNGLGEKAEVAPQSVADNV